MGKYTFDFMRLLHVVSWATLLLLNLQQCLTISAAQHPHSHLVFP